MDPDYYARNAYMKYKQHEMAQKHVTSINTVFTIVNITIVSFTGIANNITTILGANYVVYDILFSCLLYISLLTTGLQKFFRCEELIGAHGSSSLNYSLLYQNIREGSIPEHYILGQYQLLQASEPNLPDFVSNTVIEVPDESPATVHVGTGSHVDELDFELDRLGSLNGDSI